MFKVFLLVLGLFLSGYGVTFNAYNVEVSKAFDISGANFDTLSGGSDSSIVVPRNYFESGYQYVLKVWNHTGVDSVKYYYRTDVYGGRADTTIAFSFFNGDTISGQSGTETLLPIQTKIIGQYFRVMAKAISLKNGSKTIINNMTIYKAKISTK